MIEELSREEHLILQDLVMHVTRPQGIYYSHLVQVEGVTFTHHEVTIMGREFFVKNTTARGLVLQHTLPNYEIIVRGEQGWHLFVPTICDLGAPLRVLFSGDADAFKRDVLLLKVALPARKFERWA